jgi:hypothetical protein
VQTVENLVVQTEAQRRLLFAETDKRSRGSSFRGFENAVVEAANAWPGEPGS